MPRTIGRTDLSGILLCFATSPALLKGTIQVAEGLFFGDSLLSRRCKENDLGSAR
jgi:hypothetical protein